jgi:hypothetical protein
MTTKRRRGAEPAVQGELEMTLAGDPTLEAPAPMDGVEESASSPDLEIPAGAPDDEARVSAAEAEPPAGDDPPPAVEPDGDVLDGDPAADARLAEALDGLDRRVTLMVERYEELAARHGRTLEERRADRAAMERLAGSGASPAELDGRIRALQAENDRLTRHAGFLEERIQGLLARVRYVMEA